MTDLRRSLCHRPAKTHTETFILNHKKVHLYGIIHIWYRSSKSGGIESRQYYYTILCCNTLLDFFLGRFDVDASFFTLKAQKPVVFPQPGLLNNFFERSTSKRQCENIVILVFCGLPMAKSSRLTPLPVCDWKPRDLRRKSCVIIP